MRLRSHAGCASSRPSASARDGGEKVARRDAPHVNHSWLGLFSSSSAGSKRGGGCDENRAAYLLDRGSCDGRAGVRGSSRHERDAKGFHRAGGEYDTPDRLGQPRPPTPPVLSRHRGARPLCFWCFQEAACVHATGGHENLRGLTSFVRYFPSQL